MLKKTTVVIGIAIITVTAAFGCGQKEPSEEKKTQQEDAAKEIRKGNFKPSSGKAW
jgi:hypothetical protein